MVGRVKRDVEERQPSSSYNGISGRNPTLAASVVTLLALVRGRLGISTCQVPGRTRPGGGRSYYAPEETTEGTPGLQSRPSGDDPFRNTRPTRASMRPPRQGYGGTLHRGVSGDRFPDPRQAALGRVESAARIGTGRSHRGGKLAALMASVHRFAAIEGGSVRSAKVGLVAVSVSSPRRSDRLHPLRTGCSSRG